MPAGIERVAVFLPPAQELIDAVIGDVCPDCLQMDAHDIAALRLPPASACCPWFATARRPAGKYRRCSGSCSKVARSGAGEKADWTVAARLAQHADLVLAGGLDAANVAAAIAACVRTAST